MVVVVGAQALRTLRSDLGLADDLFADFQVKGEPHTVTLVGAANVMIATARVLPGFRDGHDRFQDDSRAQDHSNMYRCRIGGGPVGAPFADEV